jgi:carbonic anhydrase/acetyltransferase-like protein (isoleucine patch superfamily)
MPIHSLDGITPELPPTGQWWLAPDAQVIGRVRLARDVGIWFGAVIRGDNESISVGEGTNIQEHSMLHTDLGHPLSIGKGCTIGHRAILHGCMIGDNCLVGMGAIILNGAKIGSSCLVGAGALVTEGREFPDNSLIVGAPAKAIRTLDDTALARIRGSAESYIRNWKRYATGLKPG